MIKKIIDRDGETLEENVSQDLNVSDLEMIRQSITNLKKDIAAVEFSKSTWKTKTEGGVSFLQEGASPQNKRELKIVSSPLKPGQVLSSETSYLMAHLLKENVLYGTGRRARELKRTASGKTGTTDENRDAWFIGFTPDLVASVWVGHDDLKVLGRNETGSQSALPIWVEYMARATVIYPESDFQVPPNIEFARIDPKTGGLASPQTKNPVFEAFIKGTAPQEVLKPKTLDRDLYERDL